MSSKILIIYTTKWNFFKPFAFIFFLLSVLFKVLLFLTILEWVDILKSPFLIKTFDICRILKFKDYWALFFWKLHLFIYLSFYYHEFKWLKYFNNLRNFNIIQCSKHTQFNLNFIVIFLRVENRSLSSNSMMASNLLLVT